tara:strand:- start:7490 stop:9085 length:1596 start_codon:yes stop_codon:yes gene_type:complete
MDRNRLNLYLNTVKHLKIRQLYYQVYYKVRNKLFKRKYKKKLPANLEAIQWQDQLFNKHSYDGAQSFSFLNIDFKFKENHIDWNKSDFGKLWTYNLNYFDFLNQYNITTQEGITIIKDYIRNEDDLQHGLEPYPISLRGINWIKFLSKNSISEDNIDQVLYNHYQTLLHNLEYHLLGNHLLENGFSLLFGAYYFKDLVLYSKGKKIITDELNEEILEDGGHFELSPMYHQIILYRLLDCINLIRLNTWQQDDLLHFLEEKAKKMLSWLDAITYSNGNIPMVNDSAFDIAPTSSELFGYANTLNLIWEKLPLSESGYRKFQKSGFELFVDVGNIGPIYQSGHAHADTFSFELYFKDQPIIVDSGISTYENNELRRLQRATKSHNTIEINHCDQSQMWDAFRVAKRAYIIELKEKNNYVEASHDGYKELGIVHTRKFDVGHNNNIIIHDSLSIRNNLNQIAFLHFHPQIKEIVVRENQVVLLNENITIKFKNIKAISKGHYEYPLGFNKFKSANKLTIGFDNWLETNICLNSK